MENETYDEVVEEEVDETSTDDGETSENTEEQNPSNDKEKTLQAQKDHWKKKYEELKNKPEAKEEFNKTNESNQSDYSKIAERLDKAELTQLKVSHPDDQQMVIDEAKLLKRSVAEVAGMAHMKSQLSDAKAQRSVEKGMPKGRGDASSKTKADVDYWLNKGETPDNQELAEKVINARMKKEADGNKFSDQLYSG